MFSIVMMVTLMMKIIVSQPTWSPFQVVSQLSSLNHTFTVLAERVTVIGMDVLCAYDNHIRARAYCHAVWFSRQHTSPVMEGVSSS